MAQKIISEFFKEFHNANQGGIEPLENDVLDVLNALDELDDLAVKENELSFKGQLTNIEDIIRYSTARNATITLKSQKTNTRFTYKIQKPKNLKIPNISFFVKLMNGPSNENNFEYLGCIYTNNTY